MKERGRTKGKERERGREETLPHSGIHTRGSSNSSYNNLFTQKNLAWVTFYGPQPAVLTHCATHCTAALFSHTYFIHISHFPFPNQASAKCISSKWGKTLWISVPSAIWSCCHCCCCALLLHVIRKRPAICQQHPPSLPPPAPLPTVNRRFELCSRAKPFWHAPNLRTGGDSSKRSCKKNNREKEGEGVRKQTVYD